MMLIGFCMGQEQYAQEGGAWGGYEQREKLMRRIFRRMLEDGDILRMWLRSSMKREASASHHIEWSIRTKVENGGIVKLVLRPCFQGAKARSNIQCSSYEDTIRNLSSDAFDVLMPVMELPHKRFNLA